MTPWESMTEEEKYARWSIYCNYTTAQAPMSYSVWCDLMEGSIWQ